MPWIKIKSDEFKFYNSSGKWAKIWFNEASLTWMVAASNNKGYRDVGYINDAKALAEGLVVNALDVMESICNP